MARRTNPVQGSLLTTLVLGLLVLIMLTLISIPGIRRMRANDARQSCLENLALITAARERYAVDYDLRGGATVPLALLIKEGKLLKTEPVCPSGGKYSVNPLGVAPTCSYKDHVLPIVKPAAKSAQ